MVFDFCYTAEITLTAKNVMAVLSAVKFLQIDSLKEGGVEFLEDLISADHWREIYSQAAQLNAKSLVKSCLKEYDDEISDVDLRGFSLEKSFTLLKYRKDDKPSSKLFQMVKYRIKCCTDNMQTQYFKELVDSVNFEGMTRKHWETLIQNDLIKAFPSTQTKVLIIHDTKKDHPDVLICAGSMIAARKGSKHIRSSVEIYSTKYQRIRFFCSSLPPYYYCFLIWQSVQARTSLVSPFCIAVTDLLFLEFSFTAFLTTPRRVTVLHWA